MSRVFDRIVIAVPELGTAVEQYQRVLACPPEQGLSPSGEPLAWWGMSNTVIELVEDTVETAQLRGIVFNLPGGSARDEVVSNGLGLDIRRGDGGETADFRSRCPESQCLEFAVDHLVLRTVDAQACVSLFNRELGIRLALDKTVPEWGGRMLFFRGGKLTLEVIESAEDGAEGNFFWGIAYQCNDLAQRVAALAGAGVRVSEARDGRKPGTRVATLKSHDLGIPTLLIQPVS